jgi:hypothetical protein
MDPMFLHLDWRGASHDPARTVSAASVRHEAGAALR